MINFCSKTPKGLLVGLGLNKTEMDNLLANRPVKVNLQQEFGVPLPITIIVYGGQTDEDMEKQLRVRRETPAILSPTGSVLPPSGNIQPLNKTEGAKQ